MGRNDGSGGKWIKAGASGARRSRLGNGRGRRRSGGVQSGQSTQQFPVIQPQFKRREPQGDQPTVSNTRSSRSRKQGRRGDGQK